MGFEMRTTKILASRVALIPLILVLATLSFADELAQIQSAIRVEGAGWTAGETSISRLPSQERRMRLGLVVPQLTGKEKMLPYVRALVEPASFDWRNNNGNYVTPIRDQGTCGSCWAFAVTGALESVTLIAQNTPDINLNLAEQILVSCSTAGDCGGGYIETASDYVRDTGLPLESSFRT